MKQASPGAHLWYTRCPIPTAFSLALHGGELERRLAPIGLHIESLRHSPDPAVRLSHFTHSLPGQTRHGGHIPPLWSRSEGRDIRLIGLSWANEGQFVLVDRDSDLESLSALKGRRLAVPRRARLPVDFWRATVLRGYENALATVNLSLSDVELVEIEVDQDPFPQHRARSTEAPPGVPYQTLTSQTAEGRALVRREVDAIFSPAHYGVALKSVIGARVLADLSQLPDRFAKLNNFTLLAFTIDGAFLDRNPDAVTQLLRSAVEAAGRARENPAEAARTVAAESGNAVDLVEDIFGEDFAADLTPRLDDEIIEALTRQGRFLHAHGFIRREVPIEEWIERGPLEAALKG